MDRSKLFSLLEIITTLLQAEQRRMGAEQGLQNVHVQILGYLYRCNRFSDNFSTLVNFLGLTKGTVSQSVQLLKQRGYVTQQKDAADKRKFHLKLTASGEELAMQLSPPQTWRTILSAMPEDDQHELTAAFEMLLKTLQASNTFNTFGVCSTCKHLQTNEGHHTCGLTGETLQHTETSHICPFHGYPA